MFIYQILNTLDNMCYIGLSTKDNFNARYRGGYWSSRTHNQYLKRAAKKHGKENFIINILEDGISNEKILSRQEKYWISKFNCIYPNGYNFPSPDVVEVNGKEYEVKNIKTGETIKIKNLTKFCKEKRIGIKAMNAMLTGRQLQSFGYCLPNTIIPTVKKTLLNPVTLENVYTGERVIINNITQFCKERGLNYKAISGVIHLSKYKQSYKGWKLPTTQLKEKVKYKNIYLYSPEGEIIFVENLYNFCNENNICYNNMLCVAAERSFQHKGWKLLKNKDKNEGWRKNKERIIIDSHNNIITVDNISHFCREKSLDRYKFDKMLKGKIKQYEGYKLYE